MLLKKYVLLGVVLLNAAIVFADELKEGCESAVDAADKLQTDLNKDCDYSNTGLNGVLHRALNNKKDNVATDASEVVKKTTVNSVESKIQSSSNVLNAEFNSAQQLANQRYDLVQKAAKECDKGFVVNSERYLPVSAKSMTLVLNYQCL